MLWECFPAGGPGALHNIHGVMKKEQRTEATSQQLHLGHEWNSRMDDALKHMRTPN